MIANRIEWSEVTYGAIGSCLFQVYVDVHPADPTTHLKDSNIIAVNIQRSVRREKKN